MKARSRSVGTFGVWAGALALALGTQALPGFAQPEDEEEPVQARPAPEEKVRIQEPGAGAKGALRPSAKDVLAPSAGQQAPSAEVAPPSSPEAGGIQKEQQIPQR